MMQEEDGVKKDERYSYIETKPIYSSNVLTGNWFQTRWENLPQNGSAVVPCVLPKGRMEHKGCERHVTTNQEAYSLEEFDHKDMTRIYIEAKLGKFNNFMSQRASIKLLDAEKYNDNYTSLNTLVYELWPKMLRQQQELAKKNASDKDAAKHHPSTWKPDTLDSFGTYSSIKRRVQKEPLCPVATSYKLEFQGRYASPVKSAKMKDMIDRL